MKQMQNILLFCIGLMLVSISVTAVTAQDYYYDDYEDVAAWTAFGGLACFGGFALMFIIWIVLAIWVYRDAQQRDGNGALWLIIVIITGIIGLIIWLIVRPPIGGKPQEHSHQHESSDRRCPSCGRVIPDDARVCPYCGKNFDEA